MNPERLAELQEERRFLLRSIRDLDREHAAGDVDHADFVSLRDGYVARAAAVLREIDDGRSSALPRRTAPWWRRAAVVVGTLVAAVGIGLVVANSAGQRLPGQSLTGGEPADEVAVQLANARQSMGNDPTASLEAYAKVLQIEPDNVEAITYSSWLAITSAKQLGDQPLMRAAVPGLEHAIELDPGYADAHCFLAIVSGRFLEPVDAPTAVAEGNECIAANPPAALRAQIEAMVAELSTVTPTT